MTRQFNSYKGKCVQISHKETSFVIIYKRFRLFFNSIKLMSNGSYEIGPGQNKAKLNVMLTMFDP